MQNAPLKGLVHSQTLDGVSFKKGITVVDRVYTYPHEALEAFHRSKPQDLVYILEHYPHLYGFFGSMFALEDHGYSAQTVVTMVTLGWIKETGGFNTAKGFKALPLVEWRYDNTHTHPCASARSGRISTEIRPQLVEVEAAFDIFSH